MLLLGMCMTQDTYKTFVKISPIYSPPTSKKQKKFISKVCLNRGMIGLEELLRKGMPIGLVATLGCHGSRDSRQSNETGRDSSYINDFGDDSGDTDTSTYNAPVITSASAATAYLNQEFTYRLTAAQDTNSGALSCTFNAPIDISVNNCTFTWTPTDPFDVGQSYTIDMEVSDNNGEDEAALGLTVGDSTTNTAPVIETTSLSNAITQTPYTATIDAFDAEGDALTYSLVDCPSWLRMSGTTLSGNPSSRGTETVTVEVSDGEFDVSQTYSLQVDSIASLDMEVIDGDSGDGVDDSCNVSVTLTNASSGYAETVTAVGGYATFDLDETRWYNISIPSTNTGSNCYGGVSLDEWIDVSSGSNTSWVTLIPETYATEVASVVGTQIDMGDIYGHAHGDVDTVTKLLKYEVGVNSRLRYTCGWNSNIKDGTYDLEVDTIDWTNNSIQYNDGLQLAIGYWDGNLAPSVVQIVSGGDIWFTRASNWQTVVNTGSYSITDVEINYTAVGSADDVYDVATLFAHEMGSSLFEPTEVDVFIMNSWPSVDEPHELELLLARVYNNIGALNPTGTNVDLYNGYLE